MRDDELRAAIARLADSLESGIVETEAGPVHARQSESIAREVRALLDIKPKHEARKPHPLTMAGR